MCIGAEPVLIPAGLTCSLAHACRLLMGEPPGYDDTVGVTQYYSGRMTCGSGIVSVSEDSCITGLKLQ